MLACMTRAVGVVVACSAVWLVAACGGSSEDELVGPGKGGSAGSAAAAGSGALGGGSGSGAAGGSGGSAGNAGAGALGGAAGAAGVGGIPGNEIDFDPTAITESANAFPAGIQAGDPRSDAAVLWTRYAGSDSLVVRVFTPTNPGKALLFHESTASPTAEGYVHVDATGLPPLTELNYVFLEDQGGSFVSRSPIGRLVTAPAAGQKPVIRFGGTSCTGNDRAPFDALQRGGEEKLDFFILAGDTTYNDSANTLSEYRTKWLGQIGEGTYQSLLQSTATYSTWDDHEVDNDWNPETFNAQRLAAATTTFFEHLPILRNNAAPDRIWRSYRWGDTLEVFILDSRSERKPSTATGQNAQYLSPEQISWVTAGLKNSTATFKIVVNSVPITDFPGLFDFAQGDRWEGYAAQRTKFLDFIEDNNIQGVLFVSGDFHLGASAKLEPSGKWSGLREVLMGPGDKNGNPLWFSLPQNQFDFRTGTSNVTVFEADPNASPPTIKVSFISGTGSKLFEQTYSF